MTLPARSRWLACALLWAAGCNQVVDVDDYERGACPPTGEFGNYGCARIVVMVEGPPQPWPALYRWHVYAKPAREGTGFVEGFAPHPDTGAVPLLLIRHLPPAAGSADSASVWVHARLLEDPRPIQPGVPLPTFAADSVLRVVQFAPVGERPRVDTVRLTLQRR
ncbi:MAG TPA: hypothetical protein VHG08_13790 [Longimicrobium sp.]|nr:hypothetical protein [Longimicrobium sp.]